MTEESTSGVRAPVCALGVKARRERACSENGPGGGGGGREGGEGKDEHLPELSSSLVPHT